MTQEMATQETRYVVDIPMGAVALRADLVVPERARGIVLFSNGNGGSRFNGKHQYVASQLYENGFAALVLDLLTETEEVYDQRTAGLRFDTDLLGHRLVIATQWALQNPSTAHLPIGYFAAGTGAAAALAVAANHPDTVHAVVSRGGRPDLAGGDLARVRAPTLLIVGELDAPTVYANREARTHMTAADTKLVIVPGATHVFEERGALESVARLARRWFGMHLGPAEA